MNRLHALTDGVYAISMTLLVLELHVPDRWATRSGTGVFRASGPCVPNIAVPRGAE